MAGTKRPFSKKIGTKSLIFSCLSTPFISTLLFYHSSCDQGRLQIAVAIASQSSSTMASPNDNNEESKATSNEDTGEKVAELERQAFVSNTYTTNDQPNNPLPLDWTMMGRNNDDADEIPVRCPHEVAEWSPEDTDVCIVGTAGQKITILGDDFKNPERTNLEELTSLVLRSHLIKEMPGLDSLPKLETLELYDNMVQSLDEESLKGCGPTTLRVLDMSYNAIRSMAPVQYCNGETLTELYLASNKLKEISGIKHLKNLRKLDLGANKIRVLNGSELSGLDSLEELWVGKNKIESLEGIQTLAKLRRLDVQSNRLTSVVDEDGVCYLNSQRENLEELYLGHNGFDEDGISGLISLAGRGDSSCNFPKLTVLDLSRNRLTTTASLVTDAKNDSVFGEWPMLEELWLSGNAIEDFEAVRPLQDASSRNHLPQLEAVYLEYNPVSKDFEYRKKMAEFIPTLNQIDATMIRGHGGLPVPSGYGVVLTTEERLRQLQGAAIERAEEQNPTDS
jgi:protein phosphatase 1 regulatory subunit 7